MTLTFGSLFSGIGGIDLGLERAGMQCLWQVECDTYARKVLSKHWPHVTCYEDVRGVRGELVQHVDVLAGGFPCQDISNAGKRAGIEGERSGLWAEFFRLVCEVRPRYVLVENVAALLARGLGRVLGDLAAGGYDAEWDCVPASALGAHHQRDRVFIVAYPDRVGREGGGRAQEHSLPPERQAARHLQNRHRGEYRSCPHGPSLPDAQGVRRGERRKVFDASGPGSHRGGASDLAGVRERLGTVWESEPDVGRVAHGVPSRVDRLRCLGNAVVPQVAEYVGGLIVAHASRALQGGRT